MKLGIFDSGAGGLSILKNVLEARIFEEIIYYGDTARLPYGTKHPSSAVSYTHLTLPTIPFECRSRWSPYH